MFSVLCERLVRLSRTLDDDRPGSQVDGVHALGDRASA